VNKRKVCFSKFRTVINNNLFVFFAYPLQNEIGNIRDVEKQHAGKQNVDRCVHSVVFDRFVEIISHKQDNQTNVDV